MAVEFIESAKISEGTKDTFPRYTGGFVERMQGERNAETDSVLKLQAESTKYAYNRYAKIYEKFRCEQAHSEDIVYRFLVGIGEYMAATTLWTAYSHVKKYLLVECAHDIGVAMRINDYLKALTRQHKKKKAPALTREQLFRFLREAPSEGKDLAAN